MIYQLKQYEQNVCKVEVYAYNTRLYQAYEIKHKPGLKKMMYS